MIFYVLVGVFLVLVVVGFVLVWVFLVLVVVCFVLVWVFLVLVVVCFVLVWVFLVLVVVCFVLVGVLVLVGEHLLLEYSFLGDEDTKVVIKFYIKRHQHALTYICKYSELPNVFCLNITYLSPLFENLWI